MKYTLSFLFGFVFLAYSQTPDPLLTHDEHAQTIWVDSVYNSLSLEEKVGQLFMSMVFTEKDSTHFNQTLALVKNQKLGGLIFSLGGPVEQSHWLNRFQAAAQTPLLVAMDAEWGVAMRLDSVQPFPWPMTLGAVQDTVLLRKIGRRMGEQEKRLGIHYSFSPVLDINTNPNNPIIGNRSFGASKERVIRQARAVMKGHHDAGILTSGKHFPGHGDTSQDSHKTLPSIAFSSERIKGVELAPYRELIDAGLSSVMVAHLNVPSLTQKGLPTSLSKEVIQKLLIEEMGFKGLVVTDALNMKGVSDYAAVENIDLTAFKAGHDMLLISNDIPKGIRALVQAYKDGELTENRLSHSVKKVLKAKYKVGLATYSPVKTERLFEELNTPLDTLLYTEAMGKALTLLKNENNLLPLKGTTALGHLALGDASSTAFLTQLKKYGSIASLSGVTEANAFEKTVELDTLIISFHRSNETPWKASNFNREELNIIKKLAAKKTVLLDVFVKPYALKALEQIQGIDALLLSYQNSALSQKLSAAALFGAQQLSGRLPVNVSDSLQEGAGIDLDGTFRLGVATPAEVGFDPSLLAAVDQLAIQAIDSLMTPGMRILAARKGKIFYDKNFGYHTYKKQRKVATSDLYDLASLTKILGTLPLVMQSVQNGELTLETTVAELLPDWRNSNKASLSLRKMLSHYAQLTPWIPFYKETLTKKGYPKKSMYQSTASPKFNLVVANDLYLKSDFETELYQQIKDSELIDTLAYKYSDLPYYLLKKYYENTTGLSYDQLVEDRIFKPLGIDRMRYNPLHHFNTEEIVPSEVDTYFRHQELDGHVHDMGAAMQNGVGGHAGLFGDARSVAILMQMYLQGGIYNGKRVVNPEVISDFNVCTYCADENRRGVGFDKPQLEGTHVSTCGCVSMDSFGHSGYTGTFAWADPEEELLLVILANRTYPNDDFTFSKSNIRTRIQEYFYQALID